MQLLASLLVISLALVSAHVEETSCTAPAKCIRQFINVDFYGNDITVYQAVPNSNYCCDLCASTPGCKAYTYSKFDSLCYVKFVAAEFKTGTNFVSGMINEE